MPKQGIISKTTQTVRLYAKDQTHIENMVQGFRFTETNFANVLAAIRYYINLGFSAETRVGTAHSLDGKIIREAQKEVV